MDEPPQADLDRKGKRIMGMTRGPLARTKRINRAKEGYNVMGTVREDEEEENEESQKKPKTAAELTERLKELTVKVGNISGSELEKTLSLPTIKNRSFY